MSGKKVTLYTDGGCDPNPGRMAIAAVVYDGEEEIGRVAKVLDHGTNNVAEYEGLIAGLELCNKLHATEVVAFSDSKLMVKQITGKWRFHKEHLQRIYRAMTWMLKFETFTVKLVPRENPRITLCDLLLKEARGKFLAEQRAKGKTTLPARGRR